MCGIAGLVESEPSSLASIFAMAEIQSHRGPDGQGFLVGDDHTFRLDREASGDAVGQVALGHRRLAILDPTDAGLQPMSTPDERVWLTYNGEVYNYIELRRELAALGHAFTTGTDTEVILAAYREWGTGCFARFNGMWALAIWDRDQRVVVLARDRLGIKPLHVARVPGGLVFASEIKAVLADGRVRARLNPRAAVDYLKWRLVNHTDETFFAGIDAFPPGTFAVIDPHRPHEWAPQRYWDLTADGSPSAATAEDAAATFRDLFAESVRLRMRSDVPVGFCLSGGLDSSSVVATAALVGDNDRLETFTSCYTDPEFDERRWADLVNEQVGAAAHHLYPSSEAFLRDHQDIIWHQEEPFAGLSQYSQWEVMRGAHDAGIKVMLDGQGGDEALCGYRKYYYFYLRLLLVEWRLLRMARELVGLARRGDRGLLRLRDGKAYLPGFMRSRQLFGDKHLMRADFAALWDESRPGLTAQRDIRERQVSDLLRFSLPVLLRYEDRNSMAWSIEARVPFLDHRLLEFAVRLPPELKMREGRSKVVLRDGLAGVTPGAVLERRTKMAFVAPQSVWLRGELRDLVERRLANGNSRVGELLDPGAVMRAYREELAGRERGHAEEAFRVFLLDAWMERFDVAV